MLKIPNKIHCVSVHGIQCECFHEAQIFSFCKMLSSDHEDEMMRNELHEVVCPGMADSNLNNDRVTFLQIRTRFFFDIFRNVSAN